MFGFRCEEFREQVNMRTLSFFGRSAPALLNASRRRRRAPSHGAPLLWYPLLWRNFLLITHKQSFGLVSDSGAA